MEAGDRVRVVAPALADALSSVTVAGCESEREAVFRFRYSVYVEELHRGVGTVDERRRWVRDPEDDDSTTLLLYTTAGDGTVTGTARLRGWPPGAVPNAISDRFATVRFDGIDRLGTAELGRVMVRPDERGHYGLVALACACYQLASGELGADLVFLTCLTGLVRHYQRTGFRTYAAPLVPTTDGVTVPMVLVLSDRSYLDSVGSFLAPLVGAFYGAGERRPVDMSPWAGLFDADSAPVELDATAVWGRVQRLRAAAPPAPAFLDALDGETIHKLADRGFLMTIDAGQLLTKKDLVQRELFVVLDGTFEVHDGDRRLCVVGRGEVIGEIGFFGTAQRRRASVTALTRGQVLVLRRRWLDELRRSDPQCAADILFQLARALADRVAAWGV